MDFRFFSFNKFIYARLYFAIESNFFSQRSFPNYIEGEEIYHARINIEKIRNKSMKLHCYL